LGTFSATWEVPAPLTTAFQQYLNFFSDFVENISGFKVFFEVTKIDNGLKLVAKASDSLKIEDINYYLEAYVSQNLTIQPNNGVTKQQEFELRQMFRDWEFERKHLNHKIGDQYERIKFLGETLNEKNQVIKDLTLTIRYFEQSNSYLMRLNPIGINEVSIKIEANDSLQKQISANFDSDKLLIEILDKLIRMAERKHTQSLEDLHNDLITDWLRDKEYYVTDQTRSGKAKLTAGEIDIMVRKENGTPASIIEAFRLSSCGPKNVEISSHIDKLIHNYDTVGHECNFIIVYCESKNFGNLVTSYNDYMDELNDKDGFCARYPLITYRDTKISDKAGVKIGLAKHKRDNDIVKVYHLLVDMSK
jgi:hypothetical protein